MEKLGLVTLVGGTVLLDLSEESFTIDPDVLKALQNNFKKVKSAIYSAYFAGLFSLMLLKSRL